MKYHAIAGLFLTAIFLNQIHQNPAAWHRLTIAVQHLVIVIKSIL